MKRGSIVLISVQGDYGKPRPAVVIQNNELRDETDSVTVCLISNFEMETTLLRIYISPDKENGLRKDSYIMVDKIATLNKAKIGAVIGQLDFNFMSQLNQQLMLFLGLSH